MNGGNESHRATEPQRLKLYVASSWRNPIQPTVVNALRSADFEVYDFRHPRADDEGFRWSQIDPHWEAWDPARFRECLKHPIADRGFGFDWQAMKWADAGCLVLPSGRSAHLEAGYFVGAGKPLVVLLMPGEPELMYKMTPYITLSIPETVECFRSLRLGASVANHLGGAQ